MHALDLRSRERPAGAAVGEATTAARRARRRRRMLFPIVLLLPALAGLALFRLSPMVASLWESVHTVRYGATGPETAFVGFENFQDIYTDPTFLNSIAVTVGYNLVLNPIILVLALGLAVLSRQGKKWVHVYRVLFLLPIGVSVTIASVLWRMVLDPNDGLLNGLLAAIGLPPQPFLTSSSQALASIMMIVAWASVSFWSLFLRSGLENIPADVLEAGKIDGASAIRSFFQITIPLLRPTLLFVLVICTTANFLVFAPMYVLTHGGPEGATDSVMYQAFVASYSYLDRGHAMAMIVTLVPIIVVSIAFQFRALGSKE